MAAKNERAAAIPTAERIAHAIYILRGQKVILDADLALFYGVETKRLNEQVRRNPSRFPEDFVFQLTSQEAEYLRSQKATSNMNATGRGGRRYLPYAFTELGVAMLSSVLNSERAIAVNIGIMRAFVRLRELLSSNKELARRFAQLEARLDKKLAAHDEAITAILSAIHELMTPPQPNSRGVGFTANLEAKK